MIDSMIIARYFLFLDKRKKYFYESKNNTFKKKEIESDTFPSAGNFRLNKLLFIANILYMAKNDEFLFNNKICAFEYGPVVYNVLKNFRKLKEGKITNKEYFKLTDSIKEYIRKIYKYFSKYSDQELLNFVHEDPNWFLACKKRKYGSEKLNQEVNSFIIFNKEDFQFYQDHLSIYINHFKL